jgi:hypothetical protein
MLLDIFALTEGYPPGGLNILMPTPEWMDANPGAVRSYVNALYARRDFGKTF